MTTDLLSTLFGGDDHSDVDARILEAALEQFALTGVRRTSTDDIARRAGVNRATLYRRLGPKDDIVSAAYLYEAVRVLQHIETELAGVDDVDEYVVRMFTVTITALRGNRLLEQMLQVDREETLQSLTVGAGSVLDLASQFLAGKIRDLRTRAGTLGSPDDPATDRHVTDLAALLARLAQSLLLTQDGPPRLRTEDEMRDFAVSVLVPLVKG
ncbi:TetR/AcrR family transcriptional regulator [Rhodococcus sp. NPDC058521]|uniref:TetR/AcrR family transcriptional regulator n=1 Tax=Rhodococcus sp. NPDC058521 TaxID=3346536 RepID=UPI0036539C81